MKFFKQFGWIMFVTCLGEILKYLLPFPIPARIYAAVGFIESWGLLQRIILPVSIITVITTIVVMIVSGKVTQFILEREEDHESTSH